MIHEDSSPLQGKRVLIKDTCDQYAGQEFHVEDWWDRVGGASWKTMTTNPACVGYLLRLAGNSGIPVDDEVLYGKIGPFGYLIHVSEIEHDNS